MEQEMALEEVTLNDVLMTLEFRLGGYAILRNIFIAEPTQDFVKELNSQKLTDYFPSVDGYSQIRKGIEMVQEFFLHQSVETAEVFEGLHWDYTRMFIGPNKLPAPPWGSSYLQKEGLLFQEETLEVRQAYLKYNLLPKQYRQEPDDHIGLELDFMYQLTEICIQSLKQEEFQKAYTSLIDQAQFLENHLLSWMDEFSSNIKESANTDFYKGFADILYGFLKLDKKLLEELLPFVKV